MSQCGAPLGGAVQGGSEGRWRVGEVVLAGGVGAAGVVGTSAGSESAARGCRTRCEA